MKFLTILKQSVKAIMTNKVRSFLTVLGIIIGVGSVIGLMSMGTGIKEAIGKQIGELGSTDLTVTSGINAYTNSASFSSSDMSASSMKDQKSTAMLGSAQTLTREDLEELQGLSSDLVSYVAGYISSPVIFKHNGEEQRYTVLGVSEDYYSLYNLQLSEGRIPLGQEILLGEKLAQDLFGEESGIDQKVTVQNVEYTVVGIMEIQDENNFSNPNLQAYISEDEAFKLFDTKYYSSIIVQAKDESTVDLAREEIETILLKSHGIEDKDLADFTVMTSKDLLVTIDSVMSMLTSFLAGIAAISLLVGGIGIMNIMLVSVTERTREIGLRKALGAKTSDILIQFMTEAVVLTVIGGVLGMTFGYTIGIVAGKFLEFNAVITIDSVLLAVGISSFIGIVFGLYPAARASRLNPIDALRYE